MLCSCKVWNHLDESIKHLPLKTFKNKVKLNILQSYCSWVFNRSLLLLFLFLPVLFFFSFWPIICFAQALVPTYVLYLNIIYFHSAELAFQLFWVNVSFFLLIYYVCKLSLTSQFGNKASSCCCSGKCPCYWRRRGSESLKSRNWNSWSS